MSYMALYRKFRPETFAEVKGQDHIVTTLTNQLLSDRIGHAYLFCGTRGTGKTTVAKILARAVNCEHPADGNPCGECEMCRMIRNGSSMNVIEIDAASNNGVDNIRDIREEVSYPPAKGRFKVYIIDEVHMLSTSAFNALLKTLEEPPSYVIFILATTEAHKIPATILSRCQRYDFHRISLDTIAGRIRELLNAEGVQAEEKAVRYVAKMGDGSMRDALSLLDQCIAFYLGEELTYDKVIEVLGAVDQEIYARIFEAVLTGKVSECLLILEDLLVRGRELTQFAGDFAWYLRNLLLLKTAETPEDVVDASAEMMDLMKQESLMADEATLMRYIRIMSELSGQLRNSTQKRVLTELALIRLCRPQMETDLDSVLDRVRTLEEKMEELPSVMASLPQPGTSGAKEQNASVPVKEPEPKLAAPEDLKRLKANWKSIVNQLSGGTLKVVLQGTEPKYNSDTAEPMCFVELPDSTMGEMCHNNSCKKELEEVICQVIGVSVPVTFLYKSGQEQKGLASIRLSAAEAAEAIRAAVAMPVEIEEES
ncbi:MAG: DNA polymerase III subunit gamma/tau [Blautia sp.]|nr:DNA polymerase III subunit gamma/tau [Blautia sp.]